MGATQGMSFFIFKRQTFIEYSVVKGIIFIRKKKKKHLKLNQTFFF